MALPKGDKMEFIVQKAVELGVSRIVPYLSKNCVSRPDKTEKKVERWRKIAAEAAKQCGRTSAEVAAVVPVAQAIAQAVESETAPFFYENERRTGLRDALAGGVRDTVSLMVGPEGGFDPAEAKRSRGRGTAERFCSVHASCGGRLRRLRRLRPCSMPAATCEKK